MKDLTNTLVYFINVPISPKENTISSIPDCTRELIDRVDYQVQENGSWTFGFKSCQELRGVVYNTKHGFYATTQDNDYYIITDNKIALQKALFNIIKNKLKTLETLPNNWIKGEILREFYSFKKKLSKSKYFDTYPEDFL